MRGAGKNAPAQSGWRANSTSVAPAFIPLAMAGLRFDGIYHSGGNFLRFYPDGDVVVVSSTGAPDQIAQWISRTSDTPVGYSTKGDEVCFDLWIERGEDGLVGGAIVYSGRIADDGLHLRVTSEVTNYDTTNIYEFFAVKLID